MTAQVLPFRPREQKSDLPSDVEQDTCSCPSCREPANVIPQPKEEPFSG